MQVACTDQVCAAGGAAANEDAVGTTGTPERGAAWVIDGATGVGERERIPGWDSDAQWYAQRLSQAFAQHALQDRPVPALFRSLIEGLAEAYRRESEPATTPAVPRHALPSAAAAWIRWDGAGCLTFAALGDCKALLRQADGKTDALGPRTAAKSDDRINQAVRRLQDAGLSAPEAYRAQLARHLRANRDRMNTPEGYWVFSVHPEAADHLDLDRRTLQGDAEILLMTDGFFRLVDTYRAYDPDGLFDAVRTHGLEALLGELRAIEAADPNCLRYPRLKPADDAAAVYLLARPD